MVVEGVYYNQTARTMTCIISGQLPVDSITWLKDGSPVGAEFSQSQIMADALTAHTLTSNSSVNFVGSFTCTARGSDGVSINVTKILDGVNIINSNFTVGDVAMVTCSNEDEVANRIEIVSESDQISQASVETLSLIINPVPDSLHNTNVTCTVNKTNGMVVSKTFTVTLDVPPNPLTATVDRTERPMAGSEFTLGCIIRAIPGFENVPTAQWTDVSGGDTVTTGSRITVETLPGSATLTFNPLQASDSATYRCSGSLTTSAQKDSPLTVETLENLRVQSKLSLWPECCCALTSFSWLSLS